MKLATFAVDGRDRVGVVAGDTVYDLAGCLEASGAGSPASAQTLPALLGAGRPALDQAQAAVDWARAQAQPAQWSQPLSATRLRAPLPAPGKLLCLADNYPGHILESGLNFPGKDKMIPRFFCKPTTAIIGPGEAIRIPASVTWTDWEMEMAVVIGQRAFNVSAAQAPAYIAGYVPFNDISARTLTYRQDLPPQPGDDVYDWLVGKWVDTFGPMGPWITTADEIADSQNLKVRFWLNDELHQDGNTGQMLFSPAEAIAFISRYVTLEPGDLISTGTPSGVGLAKNLGLKPGDRIRGEVEGLGVLENTVEAAPA